MPTPNPPQPDPALSPAPAGSDPPSTARNTRYNTLPAPPGVDPSDPDALTMEAPPPEPPTVAPVSGRHGVAHVPGYEILKVLGRGGMGVVYYAKQTMALGVTRYVALKMLLPEAVHDVRSLVNEASAIVKVSHENVVKIYDVGEHEGQPYLSLEYVDGGSLADRSEHGPMPSEEAARLVEQIARGVHAAHEAGVVHRDLKPHNVLMTRSGVPKVTDFGLAKQLEGDNRSRTGMIKGTPRYMAPEQAAGRTSEVGAVTDVHALGAILYDLLTGRPPFGGDSEYNTLEQVKTVEPVPPRRLRPDVPKALSVVCMKCLEKSPRRRYPSAAAVADDLRRFLHNETIAARSVGPVGKAWRLVERRPAETAAVVLGLATLVVGSMLGVAGVYRGQLEERARVAEAAEAEAQRTSVELRRQKNELEEKAREVETLKAAAEDRARRAAKSIEEILDLTGRPELRDIAELQGVREKLLAYYDAATKERAGDPNARQDLADITVKSVTVLKALGKHKEAIAKLREASIVYYELMKENPPPEVMLKRVRVRVLRASLHRDAGEPSKGRDDLATALTELGDVGKTHAGFGSKPESVGLQAEIHHGLGEMARDLGEYATAAAEFGKALELRKRLAESDPSDANRRELARAYGYLGDDQLACGRKGDAEKSYQASHDIRQALAAATTGDEERSLVARFQLARSFQNLGNFHSDEPARGAAEYARAVEIQTALVKARPRNREYLSDLATSCEAEGRLLWEAGEADQARPYLERAVKLYADLCERVPDNPTYQLGRARAANSTARLLLPADAAGAVAQLDHAEDALRAFRKIRQNRPHPEAGYQATAAFALRALAGGRGGADWSRLTERALTALARTVDAGYRDFPRLLRDKTFNEVWGAGWKQRVADLEREAGPPK